MDGNVKVPMLKGHNYHEHINESRQSQASVFTQLHICCSFLVIQNVNISISKRLAIFAVILTAIDEREQMGLLGAELSKQKVWGKEEEEEVGG